MSNEKVKVFESTLTGVKIIYPPTVFEDFRGVYVEIYNQELYKSVGIDYDFIQDDISVSRKNVLRGIHGDSLTYKLISCLLGSFYLVVVNNDPKSKQYKQWEGFTLSENNRAQILVPPNYGNGHLVLTDKAIFHYKQTTNYDRSLQFTILWNDPSYKFWWPTNNPILSKRDSGINL